MKNENNEKKYIQFKKTKPDQLDLFSFNNIFSDVRKKYSGTIELYDIIPKYIHDDIEKYRTKEGLLKPITRDFEFRKQKMILNISPAYIFDKGKAFFPTQREEIIEDVLRKFATDSKRNEFLDDRLSVRFTLYELWKELKRIKHTFSYDEIKESLNILSSTGLEIKSQNGKITFKSNMFETFGAVDNNMNIEDINNINDIEKQKEYSKKVTYFVRFNSLVSDSIKNKTWKVLNYDQCMQYRRAVSRWLHKRISHMFLTNDIKLPYNILLSTIIRDSGMTRYDRINMNLIQVQRCLAEMIATGSVDRYEMEKIYDENKKNKLADVKFLIYISHSFFDDLKLNYLTKLENKQVVNIIEQDNENNKDNIYEWSRAVLVEQLKNYDLEDKDYDKIISFIKTKSDIKNIQNNINVAISYIQKELEKNNKCNVMAIIISAIKDNWTSKTILENNQDNQENAEEITVESLISKIDNEKYKRISNEFVRCFGKVIYITWLSKLDFVEINDNKLVLSCNNNYAIDYIKNNYLKGIQAKDENGDKYWHKKGITEIVQDLFPEITDIVIYYK